jgi:hypothetical protein
MDAKIWRFLRLSLDFGKLVPGTISLVYDPTYGASE